MSDHRRHPRGDDLGAVARVGLEEAQIDVVDQVGRAPVEVGADRAHVGGGEGRHQQAPKRRRQDVHHHPDVALFGIGQAGVSHECHEARPGSRARGGARSGRC